MIYIAVLNNLIVNGSIRALNKAYFKDLSISGTATFASVSTTGNATIGGTLGVTGATTLTGKLTVNNTIEIHNGLELYYGTPYIDFHYGNSTNDYTGRIIGDANDGTIRITPKFTTPNATITTGNITTLNTNAISNAGAIVTRDMEVVDTLKSYKWDISHVANLANDFTVSPTLQLASGATIQFSAINTSTKVCTFTVTDSSSISSDSLGGVTWTQYSKVKFTMNLNDVVNSNCDGYLTAKMNSTAGTLVISGTLDDVTGLVTGTNYNAEGATIMLYEVGESQSTTYPVGIRMTAYGSNKRSYIDIYGGTSTSSWNTPHVRIGNVGGLTFNGETLANQWGIYTDRGYFSGAIVSKEGNIGGWSLDSSSLKTGTWGTTGGAILCTGTATAKSIGGSSSINGWVFTAGSKFGVTNTGALYCNDIHATGGTISGSLVSSGIDANNITAGTLSADRIGAGSITIGKINQKVYAYSNNGQGTGYAKLFTISHTDSYRNAPISFLFHNRGKRETRVSLNYANYQTPASAVIQNATYDGDTAFYYVSKGNAVYDVYFALAESWDDTYVTDYINQYSSGLEVEWSGSYYGTSLPSGAVEFTKLVGSVAKSTIDDYAKTATTYITDIDSNKGITIKPSNSSGNDYLQMNSSAISFYRNNVETVKLEDSAFRIGKLGTNMRNIYVTDEAVQIRNNTTVLAEYGSDIKLYSGSTPVVTINSNGGSFTGEIVANTGQIGGSSGWTIASQQISSGTLGSDNSMYLATKNLSGTVAGKTLPITGSTDAWRLTVGSNFGVTNTGSLYASEAIISGAITASSGYIGDGSSGFKIGANFFHNPSEKSTFNSDTVDGVYIGTGGIALGKGVFKVTNSGALTTSNLKITNGNSYLAGNSTNNVNAFYWGTPTNFNVSFKGKYFINTSGNACFNSLYIGGHTVGNDWDEPPYYFTNAGNIKANSVTTNTISGTPVISGFYLHSNKDRGVYVTSDGYVSVYNNENRVQLSAGSGSNTYRIYAYCSTFYVNNTAVTSDKKIKNHLSYLSEDEQIENFIMSLKPASYTMKNGQSGRKHFGFYAQDIRDEAEATVGDVGIYLASTLDMNDFEEYTDDIPDEEISWSLRYDELIAPLVALVQKQNREIKDLQNRIEYLEKSNDL